MKTAWLFPGQGTQKVGMGKALFDASKAAREIFERADEALGESLSGLCFEGPQETLTLTANAQPAIVTVSMAALAAIREAHPDLPAPDFAAGHSLGEYSALVAAGALSFEDAVKTVRLRGQAMQEAVPEGLGAMAAIMGGDPDSVSQLCDDAREGDTLSPANFNAKGQIVIAGSAAAVERARSLAADRKLKAIPLKVSAPFHCALMRPARDKLAAALENVTFEPLSFPVIANFEAAPNSDPGRARELLVSQVDGPVRWEQTVEFLAREGVLRALEIGPEKVLAGLAKKTDKSVQVYSVGEPGALDGIPEFLSAGDT
jgi:[acyl-carrier-protein] S-malonyltransferase